MKGTWYFLRHAQTAANVGRLYNPTGDELTAEGKAQALAAAAYVQSLKVDAVFCSPLARAQATASLLGLQPRLVTDLADRNFGEFSGKPFGSISMYCKEVGLDKETFTPAGGESLVAVKERAASFVEELPAGNFLFITHAVIIMKVYEALLGERFKGYQVVENVALWVFEDGKLVHQNWKPWLRKD